MLIFLCTDLVKVGDTITIEVDGEVYDTVTIEQTSTQLNVSNMMQQGGMQGGGKGGAGMQQPNGMQDPNSQQPNQSTDSTDESI